MRKKITFFVSLIILFSCAENTKKAPSLNKNLIPTKTIEIKKSVGLKDYTPVIYNHLKSGQRTKNITLNFEKGTYHFYPEKALQKYLAISNNDNGYKKIVFPLMDYKKVVINGNDSNFIFHGSVVPFNIEKTSAIEMRGLNIFWDKAFTFEGEVIANNDQNKTFTIKVNENDDYEIKHNEVYFKGYDWKLPLGEAIVFNKEKKRPIYYTLKYAKGHALKAREIKKGVVQFYNFNPKKTVPPIGSVYVDKGPHGQNRRFPAIRLYNSKDILFENINIYASGAMALIGEKSENISLNNFNVMLPPGSTRMIGASADATHFVNCKGAVKFNNCRFENMLDDATNVHGTYLVITDLIDAHTLAAKPSHFQQEGFDIAEKGDQMRIISRKALSPIQTLTVKNIDRVNEAHYLITFEEPISKQVDLDTAIENISWMASVKMENCVVRQNRARSILISTSKKVEILNNYFSSMMAGIRVSGDANHWFESGPVSDLTIRGNTFEDLGIGGGKPQAILQVDPVIKKEFRDLAYYHKNIVFDKNTIKTFDPHVIYALSVDGLQITNNTIIQTKTYQPIFDDLSQFDIQNCKNVLIANNKYQGDNDAQISVLKCEQLTIENNSGFQKETVLNPNKYFFQK